MQLTRKKAKTVQAAIDSWVDGQTISPEQGQTLSKSIEVIAFDWKQLAKYSFRFALACIIISVASIIADDVLRKLLARLFTAPDWAKCITSGVLAGVLYFLGIRRQKKTPEKTFSNEAIFFLGVLATAVSIAFLGKAVDTGTGHFSLLFLLAALTYGVLGLWFPSKLVWTFALLSLGSWMGAETGYASGWGAYYLGMNYPLRFVLFGAVLIAASAALGSQQFRRDFARPTRAMGLLYLFIALWIMSIFGNYGDLHEWRGIRQIELFHWSIIFAAAAAVAIFHGIRKDDAMTREFGITFLCINLYTRFFEFFWNTTHKAVFFAILGASFWFLGSRAEKIWNLGRQPHEKNFT